MMSIFEAEKRNKTAPEDQLTSRIFGALAILGKDDKAKVLFPLLKELPLESRVSLTKEQVENAAICLWKCYGGTFPDVSITMRGHLVFIEVKEREKAKFDQIISQYRAGRGRKVKDEFTYILVTNDREQPEVVKEAENKLSRSWQDAKIHWLRWPKFWKSLREIENGLKGGTGGDTLKGLISDLVSLLEVKGMKEPTGFKVEWFQKVAESWQSWRELCREISVTIDKLNEEVKKKGLEPLKPMPYYYNVGKDPKLENSEDWIPDYFGFTYKDEQWKKVTKPQQGVYLFVDFNLYEQPAEVKIGFYKKGYLREEQNEVRHKAKDYESKGFELTLDDPDDELYLDQGLPLNQLQDDKVVQKLLDKILEARDFANSIESFRKDLGFRRNTRSRRKR